MRVIRPVTAVVIVSLIAGVAAGVVGTLRTERKEAPKAAPENRFVKLWIGEMMPDFEVPTLDGSGSFKLSRDRNPAKFLVVNIHSPDCPCAANCASLVNAMQEEHAADFEVIGILAAKSMDEYFYKRAKDQVADGSVKFPLYDDPGAKVREMLGAKRTPTVWVLDREGRVAFVGAPENTLFPGSPGHRFLLKEAIDALRAGKNPETQSYDPLGCPIDPG